MYQNKKILGLIPARGGSKGIPHKNIINLCGKPLIAYTIEAGRGSKYIDELIVSTDDEEIAKISRDFGANVPFMRPSEFATDTSATIDAITHAITTLKENGSVFDILILLQPTQPLRTAEDIDEALEKYIECGCLPLVSVSVVDDHPILIRSIKEDRLVPLLECSSTCRRQDMPEFYRVNGCIYINDINSIDKHTSLNDNVVPYVMQKNHSADIDELSDLALAEFYIKNNTHGNTHNDASTDMLNNLFPGLIHSSYINENSNAIYVLTKEDKEMIVEHKKFYADFFNFGNRLLDECFPSPIQDYELTIYSAYYKILELLDTLEVMTENSLINSGLLIVRSLLECVAQLCYVLCDDNQIEKRAIVWQMMDIKRSTEDPDPNVKAAREAEFYHGMEAKDCYKNFISIIRDAERPWPNWYSYCEGKRTGIIDIFRIAGLQVLHDTLYNPLCRENHEVNHMENNIEIRLDADEKFHFKPFRTFFENHILLMDCIIRTMLPVNKMMIERYGDDKLKSEWQAYEAKSIEYVGGNKKIAEEIDKYLNPNHKWF